MKEIKIGEYLYTLETNYRDCFQLEEVLSKFTDYFEPYDYIFGDYAYDKLRLKGFYESTHKNVNNINDIKCLEQYIADYCAYGAKYFLLKKMK